MPASKSSNRPDIQPDAMLAEATDLQRIGNLDAAARLYLAILAIDPGHALANHNLGLLALQTNHPGGSLPYLNAALDAEPANPQFWLTYIEALYQDGQFTVARQVLDLARQHGLGGQATDVLTSRIDESIELLESVATGAATAPPEPERRALLTLLQDGSTDQAAQLALSLTTRFPRAPIGWKMLGVAYNYAGRNADALRPMRMATLLSPQDAETHANLALALHTLGQLGEAEYCYRRALQIQPDNGLWLSRFGQCLKAQSRFVDAEVALTRAVRQGAGDAATLGALGDVQAAQGRNAEARATYDLAIASAPELAELHNKRALALQSLGRPAEAENSFRRAIELNPNSAETINNLGITLLDLARPGEAESCFRRAMALRPDASGMHSNLLYCLACNTTADVATLTAEHFRFGSQLSASAAAKRQPHTNSRDKDRQLRVGFVSGDFFNHALASFIEPLLGPLRDHTDLVLLAYYNHSQSDTATESLQSGFAHWRVISGLSDDAVAQMIRDDSVDILVDLSGHTARNRLGVFARKPAPIQVSTIGYPGSTGLPTVDYFLADRFLLPVGQFDEQFSEKIVRMPAQACFRPDPRRPPVSPLPALANGYVTFASFNRINKINDATLDLWASALRSVPGARMLLAGLPESLNPDNLAKQFSTRGVDSDRLQFFGRTDLVGYLAMHERADLHFDTFPYNGGTTTLHALSMGVPTLTLAGPTVAARSGACNMGHVGLDEFVASNPQEFVAKAVYWAANVDRLARIRAELPTRCQRSAQAHPGLIAASMARAFRIMWRRWCEDLPAVAFEVDIDDLERGDRIGGTSN